MHKAFVSYHHANDQGYKERLVEMARRHRVLVDRSVDTGDIDAHLSDQRIRELIRDDYLRDSTVTIVLVGYETARRKHVDWEIYSSMFDGRINKKSGILAISLPGTSESWQVAHEGEKKQIYPDIESWTSVTSRSEFERRYPCMPPRIIDNLMATDAKISVVPWDRIRDNPGNLRWLVDAAFRDRSKCNYDLSTPMRRRNS